MKKRVTSALVGIGIGAPLIIFMGPRAVYLFTLIICAGCLYEYFGMVMAREYSKDIRLFGVLAGTVALLASIYDRSYYVGTVTVLLIVYCLYFLLRAKTYMKYVGPSDDAKVGKSFSDLTLSIFGILFFSLFLSYLPMLRDSYEGLQWFLLLMAVVWLGDTGAFFMGSKFGKTKLFPVISPKKTVEGSLGGVLFSLVTAALCKLIFFHSMDFVDCFVLGIIGGSFGQLGDLVESMIKRSVAVKDSGAVMPGHGGFFDRFDGIIFAAPFFYFYVKMFF